MKSTAFLLPALSLSISFSSAFADVRYTETVTVEAAGGISMFSSESESVVELSGLKSRTDSTLSMDSMFAQVLGGRGDRSDIISVDEGRSIHLLPDKKQYYVMSFVESRAQLQKSIQAMADANSAGNPLPISAENCQWTDGDLEVEHPSGSTKIAGIKTRPHTIRKRQFCHDRQTGNTCEITWRLETWLAKRVPGEGEVREFRQAYAKAMGLDTVGGQTGTPAHGLLAMFGDNWEELESEFEEMQGFPMRTIMQMNMGGETCTTASGKPIATDSLWSDTSTAAYNAAIAQTGAEAGSAVGEAASESLGDSIGGSIGGAAIGAAAGELIGGLSSMFQKKKKKPAKQAPEPEVHAVKAITVFRITTEVDSWDRKSIPSERFAEPAHWKKIKRPQ